MALTDTAIKQAKPASKPYTLTDEDGLSLQVPSSGSKWQRGGMSILRKRIGNTSWRFPFIGLPSIAASPNTSQPAKSASMITLRTTC